MKSVKEQLMEDAEEHKSDAEHCHQQADVSAMVASTLFAIAGRIPDEEPDEGPDDPHWVLDRVREELGLERGESTIGAVTKLVDKAVAREPTRETCDDCRHIGYPDGVDCAECAVSLPTGFDSDKS